MTVPDDVEEQHWCLNCYWRIDCYYYYRSWFYEDDEDDDDDVAVVVVELERQIRIEVVEN